MWEYAIFRVSEYFGNNSPLGNTWKFLYCTCTSTCSHIFTKSQNLNEHLKTVKSTSNETSKYLDTQFQILSKIVFTSVHVLLVLVHVHVISHVGTLETCTDVHVIYMYSTCT